MTEQEKAKAYDEAIERAKERHGMAAISKSDLEFIFPELAESEDERIRKEFCEAIWNYIPYEKAHKYISWLEKQKPSETLEAKCVCKDIPEDEFEKMSNFQKCLVKMIRYSDYNGTIAAIKQFSNLIEAVVKKEQKPVETRTTGYWNVSKMKPPEESLGISSEEYRQIVDECIFGKQKEQKPVEWNEETENRINALALSFLSEQGIIPNLYANQIIGAYRKGYHQALNDTSAEWSKEDEEHISTITNVLEDRKNEQTEVGVKILDDEISWLKSLHPQPKQEWSEEDQTVFDYLKALTFADKDKRPELAGMAIDWLKSIKDRCLPRPKQEWSDEDEKYFNTTISYLKDAREFPENANRCIYWLENLRPKRWRPSKEQMAALKEAFNKGSIAFHDMEVLAGLWETLKAL